MGRCRRLMVTKIIVYGTTERLFWPLGVNVHECIPDIHLWCLSSGEIVLPLKTINVTIISSFHFDAWTSLLDDINGCFVRTVFLKTFVTVFQLKLEVRKRLDEVRLLESRKSARLQDQDTDFARLADMAGDRRRTVSGSIDVPVGTG